MGIIGDFFGKAAGEAIAKPIEAVGEAVGKFVTTDKDRMAHEEKMREIDSQENIAQKEINKIQAGSTNWFISGWQPLMGWSCGFCIMLYLVPQYISAAYIFTSEYYFYHKIIKYPIDPSSLYAILSYLFGVNMKLPFLKRNK